MSLTVRKTSKRMRSGYTLVEIMVVVTILGILATIAAPMYASYVYRSKTTEATVLMAEIQRAQDTYYSLQNRRSYYNISTDADDWYPPISGNEPGDSQVAWKQATPNLLWEGLLGPQPHGYSAVYFRYEVFGDGAGAGRVPSSHGLPEDYGYVGNAPWWITRAIADLDGDDVNITFQRSSGARGVSMSNNVGWE